MALTLRGTTMQYNINLKNIKQSATNLGKFLKDYNIPRNVILEAIAKVFFFKNYNTLEAMSTKPNIIEYLNVQKRYLFEIEAQINETQLLNLFKECFTEGKAQFNMLNFLYEKQPNNFNYFHIELDLMKSDRNILTAMFLLCEKFKKMNIGINKFDYCRVAVENESFMAYFNDQLPSIKEEHPENEISHMYYDKEAYETQLIVKTLQATPTKEALEFYNSLDTKRKSTLKTVKGNK